MPRTITEKCEQATRAAPRPATGPSAAAVDPSRPHHEVGRANRGERSILIRGRAGQRAGLVERRGVEQALDALAHGESPRLVLALDVLGPAHLPGELLASLQLLDLRFPRHGWSAPMIPSRGWSRRRRCASTSGCGRRASSRRAAWPRPPAPAARSTWTTTRPSPRV